MKSFIAALAAAFVMVVPLPALAGQVTPPPVPAAIQVETGNVPYLVGHAIGTQNYICPAQQVTETTIVSITRPWQNRTAHLSGSVFRIESSIIRANRAVRFPQSQPPIYAVLVQPESNARYDDV